MAHTRDVFATATNDEAFLATVGEAAAKVTDALKAGNKILLGGNGGSAGDAQHIAGELISRFNFDRAPLAGIALTTDTSILTAIGNDYGYEHLFSRQIRGLGRPGDVFIGISTSGRSPNILAGLKAAREGGLITIGLTGAGGGSMPELCDVCVRVPSDSTPFIQQVHITVGHIICAIAEVEIFGKNQS
jgi:D-sedoheptulose 7-phosphate isomerase